MNDEKAKLYERALALEKAARKEAEHTLDEKLIELYTKTKELEVSKEKLEELLQTKTSELKGLFENLVDAYVLIDLTGNVLKMNDAAEILLGYGSHEKLNLLDLVIPGERLKVITSFKQLYEEGFITDFHVKIAIADDSIRLVHINASIIYNSKYQPIAAQGIVRDITDEKAAEQQLLDTQNRLNTLIRNLEIGVLLEDENRNVVVTNKRFCNFFNIPHAPVDMIGQNCSNDAELCKGLFQDPVLFTERINEIISNKKQVLSDELVLKDGSALERDFIPIYEDGVYKGHLWTYRDITLRRKYNEAIEAEGQKYSSIIANMNLGLIEVDTNDKITMVNQRFEEMSGYSKEELIGEKGHEVLLDEDNKAVLLQENDKRAKGDSSSYELKVRDRDGQSKYWLTSGAPNYSITGQLIGSIGIHLDITKIKNLEAQKQRLLYKLEKSNNELQEYAHVVSHDLKSPLLSINALVTWIKEDNKGALSENTLSHFTMIDETLEKMEQLISNLLEYSSIVNDHDVSRDVNLNRVMDDIVTLLHFPDHLMFTIVKRLPTIKVDRVKIQQLFQNLISNAINYSNEENSYIEIDYEDGVKEYTFSVKDNGIGINKEYHQKIFQIFQTLHKRQESTGIGLSIVKKIVDLYNGRIWLESIPGKGTTFFFTIEK
jgi:PAS domain S-box-containing protein